MNDLCACGVPDAGTPGAKDALSFVRLEEADAPAMARLELCCFSLPWSEAQYRAAFGLAAFAAFGLKKRVPGSGDALLAYVALYHNPDELEILNIAVSPEHRRQGLGGRLLDLALRTGEKMGIVNAVLEVRPSNAAALALYARAGFVRVGVRPRYYQDTGEDALIYALALSGPARADRVQP